MKGKKKILALTLGFAMLFGFVGSASAVTPEQAEAMANHHELRVQENRERLQTLVDAGRITEEQMTAALAKMAENYIVRQSSDSACPGIQPDGTFLAPQRGTQAGQGMGKGMLRSVTGGVGNGEGFGAKMGQGQGFAQGSQGLKKGPAWSR
ncbi:hypothetical protein F9B85_05040 [Heliorestis acidaminivorans]|uniref:DUF2680 domain-containing protein n=1 Tax=Heliorestis acidaminivorans TaxID=553427 RepID=A0A6I0ET96_9FIRM|nr:hypothetical protein [Heliorestis acidaminivorans]KAB2953279.1 hypothetical protein F9B85_05040 [Heliorestis acidaminivorans]